MMEAGEDSSRGETAGRGKPPADTPRHPSQENLPTETGIHHPEEPRPPDGKPGGDKWCQLAIWGTLVVLTLSLFWNTGLDEWVTGAFYRPGDALGDWPVAKEPLWKFFYYFIPVIAACLALPALGLLLLGTVRTRFRSWRLYGLFIVLSVALGPGVIVNFIFKDHWGRPRPLHTEAFGGTAEYVKPLMKRPGGQYKSFPAGHASVGFSFFVFWFLLRPHRPRLAVLALGGAVAFGLIVGCGRIVSGSHYLSDVLFAGYFSWLAAWLSYYILLRVPEREAATQALGEAGLPPIPRWRARLAVVSYVVIGVALVGGMLLASPYHRHFTWESPATPVNLTLDLAKADVQLKVVESTGDPIRIYFDWHGFGLPDSELILEEASPRGDPTQLVLSFARKGKFTELSGLVQVVVPVGMLESLQINLKQGNVRLMEAPVGVELPKIEVIVAGEVVEWSYPEG